MTQDPHALEAAQMKAMSKIKRLTYHSNAEFMVESFIRVVNSIFIVVKWVGYRHCTTELISKLKKDLSPHYYDLLLTCMTPNNKY